LMEIIDVFELNEQDETWKPIEFIGRVNNSAEEINSNIQQALSHNLPTVAAIQPVHDRTLTIIGGGPSMKYAISDLLATSDDIWTLNGVQNYLRPYGITSNAHVMLDSREANTAFVEKIDPACTYYLSSQVHPAVFNTITKQGGSIVVWHSHNGDLLKDKMKIGGGTTVGLKALNLAYVLGYRKLKLYGYDSSFEDEERHAYAQALNENDDYVQVRAGQRDFITSPSMARQAQFAFGQIQMLVSEGVEIEVFGDGLLPYGIYLLSL
jgi:hypothetical protein